MAGPTGPGRPRTGSTASTASDPGETGAPGAAPTPTSAAAQQAAAEEAARRALANRQNPEDAYRQAMHRGPQIDWQNIDARRELVLTAQQAFTSARDRRAELERLRAQGALTEEQNAEYEQLALQLSEKRAEMLAEEKAYMQKLQQEVPKMLEALSKAGPQDVVSQDLAYQNLMKLNKALGAYEPGKPMAEQNFGMKWLDNDAAKQQQQMLDMVTALYEFRRQAEYTQGIDRHEGKLNLGVMKFTNAGGKYNGFHLEAAYTHQELDSLGGMAKDTVNVVGEAAAMATRGVTKLTVGSLSVASAALTGVVGGIGSALLYAFSKGTVNKFGHVYAALKGIKNIYDSASHQVDLLQDHSRAFATTGPEKIKAGQDQALSALQGDADLAPSPDGKGKKKLKLDHSNNVVTYEDGTEVDQKIQNRYIDNLCDALKPDFSSSLIGKLQACKRYNTESTISAATSEAQITPTVPDGPSVT